MTRATDTLEVGLNSGAVVLNPRLLLDRGTKAQLSQVRCEHHGEPDDRVDILGSFVLLNADRISAKFSFRAFRLKTAWGLEFGGRSVEGLTRAPTLSRESYATLTLDFRDEAERYEQSFRIHVPAQLLHPHPRHHPRPK